VSAAAGDGDDLAASPVGDAADDESGPPPGTWAAAVAVVAPLAAGIVATVLALSLGIGTITDPEPGLWPLIVGAALALASLVQAATRRGHADCEAFTRGALRAAVGAGSLAGLAVLFERVGFELPTLVLLAFWLRVIGRESLLITTAVSVGTTAAVYVLFIVALGVPIPHLVAF
jgi:hypothetical protein